jgi:hypothetical protein
MDCRKCAADSECASDVCDLDGGTCTSSDLVLYASPTGSASSACAQSTPCTFDHAIALADATRYVIRLTPGTYNGNEVITGKQVIIDGTGSNLTGAPVNADAIDVKTGSTVTVIGLELTALTGTAAVDCDGGTVTLTRVTINSLQAGLVANPSTNCTATVDRSLLKNQSATQPVVLATTNVILHILRSTIDGGDGVQLLTSSAIAQIENSVFRNQTGADGALNGSGHFTVSFTTFVDAPLKCTSTTVATVSDSILVTTTQDAVSGTGASCIVNDSILLPQTGAVAGSNDHPNVDPLFKDKANGDFSLQSASPAIDAAPANATVPAVDFAGTPRPQGPRADLGAFEYKP